MLRVFKGFCVVPSDILVYFSSHIRDESNFKTPHGYKIVMTRMYNANQTWLLYNQLSNKMFLDKDKKNNFLGVKQIKSKDGITLMVCYTIADGSMAPLMVVGKAK